MKAIRTALKRGKWFFKVWNKQSFALDYIDKKLAQYVEIDNGFFVEAGANNGIRQSNTLFFEIYKGWRGLLIEPIPSLADECKKNRPNAIVENCALVAAEYPDDKIDMEYCNLMSIVIGAMGDEEMDQNHIQAGRRFLAKDEKTYKVTVPARTLSWVLDRHNVSDIDLLSLDVEGYEAQVLNGLDFDRHCPKFMLIEVRNQDEIEAILHDRYEVVAVLKITGGYTDMLFRIKSHPAL